MFSMQRAINVITIYFVSSTYSVSWIDGWMYSYVSTPMDWDTANQYCSNFGAQIITASTQFSTAIQGCESELRADTSNSGSDLWTGLHYDGISWLWAESLMYGDCNNCAYVESEVLWHPNDPQTGKNAALCARLVLSSGSGYQIRNFQTQCDVQLPFCCDTVVAGGMGLPGLPDATLNPTPEPTPKPTTTTTTTTTKDPTKSPSSLPSSSPSSFPTSFPTLLPTSTPTNLPSNAPTKSPSDDPTVTPTKSPSYDPTISPTNNPTNNPTTYAPTQSGETRPPTKYPTVHPSKMPSVSPTAVPTTPPTTRNPTITPSEAPTNEPSVTPSISPSDEPNISPSDEPTKSPTNTPSVPPSLPQLQPAQSTTDDSSDFDAEDSNMNGNKRKRNTALFVLPALPIEGTALLVMVLLFVAAIHHFNVFHTKSVLDDRFKIVATVTVPVLFTFICNISGVIGILMVCIIMHTAPVWNIPTYNRAKTWYYIAFISYSCGKFFLETFFINRLRNAFGSTTFRVSKITTVILYLWMFMLVVFSAYLFSVNKDSVFGAYHSVFFIVYCALECILVLTLLWLFVKRLGSLVVQQKTDKQRSIELSSTGSKTLNTVTSSTKTTSKWGTSAARSGAMSVTPSRASRPAARSVGSADDASVDNDGTINTSPTVTGVSNDEYISSPSSGPASSAPHADIYNVFTQNSKHKSWKKKYTTSDVKSVKNTLSEDQTKLIFLITRCILLNTLSLLTTSAFTVYFWWYIERGDAMKTPLYVLYSLWTVDMWINCVCLYLNFKFSDGVYRKCCMGFHGCCQSIMEYCTAKRIIESNLSEVI